MKRDIGIRSKKTLASLEDVEYYSRSRELNLQRFSVIRDPNAL